MNTFCDILKPKTDVKLFSVLESIKDASKEVSKAVRSSDVGYAGTKNIIMRCNHE